MLTFQKFWFSQYQWIWSYLHVEMSRRITAPYPLDGAAGVRLERDVSDDN